MNNKIKNNFPFILIVSATVFLFSCKKTFDKPPVSTYSYLGGSITISQLKALYGGQNIKFVNDLSLFATVTMSDNYKTVYLRDNTGTISFRQLTAHGIYQGDSLRVNLNSTWLDLSATGGSIQIDSVDVGNNVVKLAVGKNPAPVTTSIYQLLHSVTNVTYTPSVGGPVTIQKSVFDGQLVLLNGVQFLVATPNDTGGQFLPSNSGTYVNHTLTDCGSLNNIVVSTYSNTPDLVQQKVPGGSGSLIAVASFYNGALQLTLRSHNEMHLTQARCGADTLIQTFASFGGSASFNTALPGWYNINQIGYAQWQGTTANNLNFPSATTYLSGVPRNVIWLITPAIKSSPTKNILFRTATGAFPASGKPLQVSVFLSTDFNGIAGSGNGTGTNLGTAQVPSSNPAHWTDITSQFPAIQIGTSGTYIFTNSSSSPVQLSSFLPANYTGTFYIGFRYTGNQTDSTTTYGIDNVIIKN
ncbi:MAG TPA: DUF5689 domain-containing protein [Bacteroidia bacterium]|jgi:hypothetical protein|nr:DUF5689 domain-containing protein [Bacteroidia bacterium]